MSRSGRLRLALLSCLFLSGLGAARAEEAGGEPQRFRLPLSGGTGSPWPIPRGHGVAGLFRPLTVGIGRDTDLSTSGLASLVAPRLEARRLLFERGPLALGLSAGLGLPTPGLRLLRGTLLPPDTAVPWVAVLGLGPTAGWRSDAWTISAGTTARASMPLGDAGRGGLGDLEAIGLFWFDPMIAPITEGHALRGRLVIEWQPSPSWSLLLEGAAQVPAGPDLHARIFWLRAVGSHAALGLGAAGASERFEVGRRSTVKPIADLQARW